MNVVSVAEMRGLEARAELPGPALMEIAGRAVADAVAADFAPLSGRRIVVLAGPGNNGGDGVVAARWLARAGAKVVALTVGRRDDDVQTELAREAGVEVVAVSERWPRGAIAALPSGAAVVLDALLGIGRSRAIAGPMATLLRGAAESGAPIVAVDVPSGLDADSGAADSLTPRCRLTLALGAVKRGVLIGDGPERAGPVKLLDIGLPARAAEEIVVDWLDEGAAQRLLPPRPRTGHKGTFGRVLIVAGAPRYPGAALLSALGAARVGPGIVTLAAPRKVSTAVRGRLPEATYLPFPDEEASIAALPMLVDEAVNFRAIVVGPGIGRSDATAEFLVQAMAAPALRQKRWVLDADALTLMAERRGWSKQLPPDAILTPHPGEMSRLTELAELPPDRIELATRHASTWKAHVVLKGAHTVVAAPDGSAAVSAWANAALATAGSGDVLAGAIGGLLAQGLAPRDAARLGVALHSLAGEIASEQRGPSGTLAGEIADLLPAAMQRLRE